MEKLLSACGCVDEAINWIKDAINEFELFLEECDGTDFTGEIEPTIKHLKGAQSILQSLVDTKQPNIHRAINEWEDEQDKWEV